MRCNGGQECEDELEGDGNGGSTDEWILPELLEYEEPTGGNRWFWCELLLVLLVFGILGMGGSVFEREKDDGGGR